MGVILILISLLIISIMIGVTIGSAEISIGEAYKVIGYEVFNIKSFSEHSSGAALLGAIFLIWADVAARSIIPNSEMPIGILISIIGAPCLLYLMINKSYGFGGN